MKRRSRIAVTNSITLIEGTKEIKFMYLDETKVSNFPVKPGSSKKDIIKVQDWLRLNGYDTGGSDGDFGPKTTKAVKDYQIRKSITVSGVVDQKTWDFLVSPLVTAMSFRPQSGNFPAAVVEVALAHLAQHPTELDANRDGWVRTYCRGPDGEPYAWCQGFVSTIWDQAANALGIDSPIDLIIPDNNGNDIWCLFVPAMVNQARKQGKLIASSTILSAPSMLSIGSMFYVKSKGEWPYSHVGIVTGVSSKEFTTIEGNTNNVGSSNGFEVCARTRLINSCDFGLSK